MTLHSIGFVARHYGVSVSTIRRWVEKGILTVALRTFGGHRRFEVEEPSAPEGRERLNIGYARVSSHDQKPDLSRQIDRLKAEGCDQVISDIGSGLNCSKPGLKSLLRKLLDNKIAVLTVLHEDRLLRFGVDLLRFICGRMKTELRVVEKKTALSFEEELAKDVITLMTVFCARLYGRRSRRNTRSQAESAH